MFGFDQEPQLDLRVVILNNYKGSQKDLINTIILIAKQYIYSCTCTEKRLEFTVLYKKILDTFYSELQIALERDNVKAHNKKWKPLKSAM